MSAFLASVRSLDEATIAYRIGADWIDLKEPSAGALGAVDLQTAIDVVQWLRLQPREAYLSATIGDCWESPSLMPARVKNLHRAGIEYVKIGVFAHSPSPDLLRVIKLCCSIGPKIIVVCFAEDPPSQRDIAAFSSTGISGAMLDTAQKTGKRLTQIMTSADLAEFVTAVRQRELICGLAGSLSINDIGCLSKLTPDYLGFRGALCRNGMRESGFSESAATQVRRAVNREAENGDHTNDESPVPELHDMAGN